MARPRVVMNRGGFDAFRKDPTVVAALEETAEQIRSRAQSNINGHTSERPFTGDQPGEDISVTVVHNRTRAVAFVGTATIRGHYAEAANRALNRAVGG
jgi:hypothetical protein